jgi:hypothetical protein
MEELVSGSLIRRTSLVQIPGPQSPAGKQAARVPLRNSDLTSAMRADGRQRLWQPATSPAPRTMEAVRCIRLGELRAWCRSHMLPSRTRDMAIREASPLGHHSTLPAGGHVPWVCQEGSPPEPPKPRPPRPRPRRPRDPSLQPAHREGVRPLDQALHLLHGKRHPAEMGAGPDYHVPGTDQISGGGAPYIIALGLGGRSPW